MTAKYFKCPDQEIIEIAQCLQHCRLESRCATKPYLRLIGYDREFKGISPSSAGNGPRLIYLKAVKDYTVDPQERVWAAFGTSTHEKLSIHVFTHNVLSEEQLTDKQMKGIPDCLEEDEAKPGYYILTDYKSWGSFKVAKALGVVKSEEILLEDGEPVLLKSGKNKGQPKTKDVFDIDESTRDLRSEELQINRYRIFFESYGFPISKMQIQTVSRDGGTYVSRSRGIDKNMYIIPIDFLPDHDVLYFYDHLASEVDQAFEHGFVRRCDKWESWEGRRCNGFCEVKQFCDEMEGLCQS